VVSVVVDSVAPETVLDEVLELVVDWGVEAVEV